MQSEDRNSKKQIVEGHKALKKEAPAAKEAVVSTGKKLPALCAKTVGNLLSAKNRAAAPAVRNYIKRCRTAVRRKDYRFLVPLLTSAAALVLFISAVFSFAAGKKERTLSPKGQGKTAVEQDSAGDALVDRTEGAAAPIKAAAGHLSQDSALRGLMEEGCSAVLKLKEQGRQALREYYRKILDSGQGDSYDPGTGARKSLWEEVREERREELKKDPLLLLVNKWHSLPDDYEAHPVTLPNWKEIDSSCYEPLMQMLEDCAAAGGTPIVCSGYRAHWYQVSLFDAQIDRWLYAGYGQEDAEELASTAVAVPGTSEHELGLAADIYSSENMDLDESQIYTFTQQWLMQNSWRYGFILRYPQDKSDITGIIFEPWHYRYVGKEHAKKIYDAGICLEEYLDETAHQ